MDSNKQKIKSSLTYGKVFWGTEKFILYALLFVPMLFPLLTVLILYMASIGEIVLTDKITIIIFGNVFSIFLFSIILWRLIYNNKLTKKIKNWLQDAIYIKATARRLDLISTRYKPYQIEVEFFYNNKKLRHISRAGNWFLGYYKFFAESNKIINILYSPKYNEVIILKEQKERIKPLK